MDHSSQCGVLVVEGNDDLRDLCVSLFHTEGYEALGAEDGETAMRVLRAEHARIGAVVLDLRLPASDGPSFLRVKAEDPEVASIPVILISARIDAADAQSTPDVKSVVPKPIPIPTMPSEVLQWPACLVELRDAVRMHGRSTPI